MKENEDKIIDNSVLKNNKVKLSKTYMYILYFFIFSFLGWSLETLYSFIVLGHFTNRGFLYGPICPIYGFGALILIIFLDKYKNNGFKLFFSAAIICSIFEYIVSFILEALFKSHWWDYTNDFLNLNGRISIFYTFAWGFIAIIFVGHIYPFFKKKLNILLSKISYKIRIFTIYLLVFIWLIDTILSCLKNL